MTSSVLSGDSAYEVGAAGTSYVELFDEATQEPIERDLRVDNGGRDYPHELDYDLGERLTLERHRTYVTPSCVPNATL